MPRVTVCVWSCQSPAQMFLGYNSKRAQDVPGCDFEKIRRLNENTSMLGMKRILKLINEDEELREEVRLPPDLVAVSKMRLVCEWEYREE